MPSDLHSIQHYSQYHLAQQKVAAVKVTWHHTLNNIGSLKRALQYYYHSTPAKVLLGLHGDSTEWFLLNNQYCLECTVISYVASPKQDGSFFLVGHTCINWHEHNQRLTCYFPRLPHDDRYWSCWMWFGMGWPLHTHVIITSLKIWCPQHDFFVNSGVH